MKIEPVYKIDYTKTYEKYKHIAAVSYHLFYNRMINDKMPIDLALMKAPGKAINKYRIIAEENGISARTFYYRLQQGWSERKASTVPVKKYAKKSKKEVKDDIPNVDEVIMNKLNMDIIPNKKEQEHMLKNREMYKEWLR